MKRGSVLRVAPLLLMLLLLLAAAAHAEIVEQGEFTYPAGTWTIDDQGLLTIDADGYTWENELDYETVGKATAVRFTSRVETITNGCFTYKHTLTEITVDEDNPNYTAVDGILYTKDMKTLIQCPNGKSGVLRLPEGPVEVAFNSFLGCDELTQVELPETLEVIEGQAFANCYALESIYIPASVRAFEFTSFQGDDKLTAFEVSEDNPLYQSVDGVILSKDGKTLCLFPSGKTGDYAVPEGVETIAENVFRWLGLQTISLPEGLTTLQRSAFEGCSLRQIDLPASLEHIGESVFANCSALETVNFAGTMEQWAAVVIDNDNAILQFNSIHCADGDYEPQPITGKIGDSVSYTLTPDGLLTIRGGGDWDSSAFYSNERVRHVVLEHGVTKIGWDAFDMCENLETVFIPDTVTELSYRALNTCTSLKSIVIPASVTIFGYDYGDPTDGEVFDRCSLLNSVYYGGTMAQWNAWVHPENNDSMYHCTVHCADGDIPPAESSTEGATQYGENIYGIYRGRGIALIGEGATYDGIISYYGGIDELDIDEGITEIGQDCFVGMQDLDTVYLPSTLQRIGANAFSDSDAIENAYFNGTQAQWSQVELGEGVSPLLLEKLCFTDSVDWQTAFPDALAAGEDAVVSFEPLGIALGYELSVWSGDGSRCLYEAALALPGDNAIPAAVFADGGDYLVRVNAITRNARAEVVRERAYEAVPAASAEPLQATLVDGELGAGGFAQVALSTPDAARVLVQRLQDDDQWERFADLSQPGNAVKLYFTEDADSYVFRFAARIDDRWSEWSDPLDAAVEAPPLARVWVNDELLEQGAALPSMTRLHFSWDEVEGAEYYALVDGDTRDALCPTSDSNMLWPFFSPEANAITLAVVAYDAEGSVLAASDDYTVFFEQPEIDLFEIRMAGNFVFERSSFEVWTDRESDLYIMGAGDVASIEGYAGSFQDDEYVIGGYSEIAGGELLCWAEDRDGNFSNILCLPIINRIEVVDETVIPAETTVIEEEAFLGTASDSYELPEGILEIGARAFAELQVEGAHVFIPGGTDGLDIAPDAFEDSHVRACSKFSVKGGCGL